MTTQRMSMVTLGVQDVERSARFYTSIGFVRRTEGPTVVEFEPTGLLLVLRPWEDMADDLGVAPQGSGFRGLLLTFLCPDAAEVDEAYERWVAAGGVGVRQPAEREIGGRAAVVADPDAHLWELASGLHTGQQDPVAQESSAANPDEEPEATPEPQPSPA